MKILSLQNIRIELKTYQKRLSVGDSLPSFTELASIAGVHRDTLYALMAGGKVNERSQFAISKAIKEVEVKTASQTKTRVMSVELSSAGPKLSFGINKLNIFL